MKSLTVAFGTSGHIERRMAKVVRPSLAAKALLVFGMAVSSHSAAFAEGDTAQQTQPARSSQKMALDGERPPAAKAEAERKQAAIPIITENKPVRYQFKLAEEGVRVIAWQGEQAETIATIALEGQRYQLVEHRQTVYVACDLRGVAVLDVRNPRAPVLNGYVAGGTPVLGVGILGDSLVASVAGGNILRFDVSDPVHPILQQLPMAPPQRLQTRVENPRFVADDDEVPVVRKKPPKRRGVGLAIAGGSVFAGLYIWPLILAGWIDGTLAIPVAGPLVSIGRSGSSGWLPMALVDSLGQAVGLGLLLGGIGQLNSAAPSIVGQRLQFLPYAQTGSAGLLAIGRF